MCARLHPTHACAREPLCQPWDMQGGAHAASGAHPEGGQCLAVLEGHQRAAPVGQPNHHRHQDECAAHDHHNHDDRDLRACMHGTNSEHCKKRRAPGDACPTQRRKAHEGSVRATHTRHTRRAGALLGRLVCLVAPPFGWETLAVEKEQAGASLGQQEKGQGAPQNSRSLGGRPCPKPAMGDGCHG